MSPSTFSHRPKGRKLSPPSPTSPPPKRARGSPHYTNECEWSPPTAQMGVVLSLHCTPLPRRARESPSSTASQPPRRARGSPLGSERARRMLPPRLAGQGLAGLSQQGLGFGVGSAQQGGLAEGAREYVPDVALRQRLVLQQHLGQAVQKVLLLRLQGTTRTSAPWRLAGRWGILSEPPCWVFSHATKPCRTQGAHQHLNLVKNQGLHQTSIAGSRLYCKLKLKHSRGT